MKSKGFYILSGVSAIGATILNHDALEARETGSRPNVVLIVADDLGWADLGANGSKYYQTPAMDKLASEGVLFTSSYSCGPNCAPSRASIMTGLYTPNHGILTVDSSERGNPKERKLVPVKNITELSPEFITLGKLLKKGGYSTAAVGKWHLGENETGPEAHGFDLNVGGGTQGFPPSYFSPYGLRKMINGKKGEFLTERLTEEAVKFIEQNKNNPFFLYLAHYSVHTPLQAPEGTVCEYKNRKGDAGQNNPTYAAMVQTLDESVSKIVGKIDKVGLGRKTCVIFISDNGGLLPYTSNSPLRGGKGMLYEGGIRVPMIVRWSGMLPSGRIDNTPVTGVDILPTILQIAGLDLPKEMHLDGQSLLDLLKGNKSLKERSIYWHFPCYLGGGDESSSDSFFRTRPVGAIRCGDWKLLEFFEDRRIELYNLKDDIGEKKNLAPEMPEKAELLLSDLREWRKKVGAKMPTTKKE